MTLFLTSHATENLAYDPDDYHNVKHNVGVDKLSSVQAYRYLARFKTIKFLIEQYNIAHTQGFESMVSDMAAYCRRHGGAIA